MMTGKTRRPHPHTVIALLLGVLGVSMGVVPDARAGVLAVDTAGTARNGKTGYFSSMVASADEVAAAYYCEQDPGGPSPALYSVRFAWRSGMSGGAGGCWRVANIGDAGSYNSLKRDASGMYQLVYTDWNGVTWATGSGASWTINPGRADVATAPGEVSMALDSAGRPHVAYYDSSAAGNLALRYTHWTGSQWAHGPSETIANNIWTPTILAGSTFLALDGTGVPHVAYAQPADTINAVGDIKYATLQGSAWTIESLGVSGENPSLAIGTDGVARMAFQGGAVGAGLTYAYKSGGVWTFEIVPTGGAWPNTVTMALGPTNLPTIAFAMGANEDMYLATRDAAGVWTTTRIDGDGTSSYALILGRLCVGVAVDPAGQPHTTYSAITIYSIGGNVTDHYADLRYYTPGDTGTVCPDAPGACCDAATQTCSIVLSTVCPGTFNGSATCTPNPCDPPVTCCDVATSACSVVPRSQCAGTFFAGGSCTPSPCDPVGACCDAATGACTLVAASACGGTSGGSSVCSPNPCPQPPAPGACCSASTGGCSLVAQAACTGSWNGAATCSPNPCPTPTGNGACCEGTGCSVMPAPDCDHGVFQGVGVACGPEYNPTTCCPANFNQQSGLTVQDIFDFLNAWFSVDPRCDFDQSGAVAVQDIFGFLSAWFAGCH